MDGQLQFIQLEVMVVALGLLVLLADLFLSESARRSLQQVPFDNDSLRTAVAAWSDDRAAAEATYGHISTWDTSGVADMAGLFCASPDYCSSTNFAGAADFNDDISGWDTSVVTTKRRMY